MADLFSSEETSRLLFNKFVVFIGNSIQRTMYKDLVCLLQRNQYLTDKELRAKGEFSIAGDRLVAGGRFDGMHNGVNYREVREYKTNYHWLKFYFITRIYGEYMKAILEELDASLKPDVIIINSGLWDVSRYGEDGPSEFRIRLPQLLQELKEHFPKNTLIIFNGTLPISSDAKGGLLTPEIQHAQSKLNKHIVGINSYFHSLLPKAGYDFLDLHYLLQHHGHRIAEDGIHWDMTAHRRISNILLTHISETWGINLPGRFQQLLAKHEEIFASEKKSESDVRNLIFKNDSAMTCILNWLKFSDNCSDVKSITQALDGGLVCKDGLTATHHQVWPTPLGSCFETRSNIDEMGKCTYPESLKQSQKNQFLHENVQMYSSTADTSEHYTKSRISRYHHANRENYRYYPY